MKKSMIALFLALGFVAGNDAFASRARLLVTGTGDAGLGVLDTTGTGGSFYVDDAYNMFYNPSYVNEYKDWGIIERSNGNPTVTGTANAFGGFVTSMMNMNWGFFFNRTGALKNYNLQTTATAGKIGSGATVGSTMRPIEFIVGGDHGGVKWGLSALYGRYKLDDGQNTAYSNTNTGTSQTLVLKAGFQVDGFDPFIHYAVAGSERGYASAVPAGATDAFTSQVHKDMTVGTRYHWGEWTPYAAWRWMKTGAITNGNVYGLGLGRDSKVAEGVKLHYGVGAWHNAKDASARATNVVPIDLSVEGDVASWLAVRGGFNYRLWDQTGNQTNTDITQGALGATFKFGKLAVDWAVGAGGVNDGTVNTPSFGFDAGFFTSASVQYSW